jgi:hypothetical protein
MQITTWLSSAIIALLTSTIAVFLSSSVYGEIPVGSILAAGLIFFATRYLKKTRDSFWQSSLVIIFWGLITFRAATPTAMGDLILIEDQFTWWYVGLTGSAALISLIIPSKSVAKSPDAAEFPN